MNTRTIKLFENTMKNFKALTFNDITLTDIPSDVLPGEASIDSYVTQNYMIKKPFISAAMDKVSEAQMAVALAKCGGLCVIHRNLTVDEQVSQVEWVRRQVHYGGKIEKPLTFLSTDTIAKLQSTIAENNLTFTSFPIINKKGCLLGLITKDELEFANGDNPQLGTIMKPLKDIHCARSTTDAAYAFQVMMEKKVKKLPLLDYDGKLTGMYVWADVRKDVETRENFSLDNQGRLLVAAAVGPATADRERIKKLISIGCPILVIDCSHGACKAVVEQIKYIRQVASHVDIIAGNIASYDSAKYLLENGPPDALKVGIGPGCFGGNTYVLMANGEYKLITKVQKGDRVLNMHRQPVTVVASFSTGMRETIMIKTSNWDEWTEVTADHRYWTGDEWCVIENCRTFFCPDGHQIRVEKKKTGKFIKVYDLQVDCPTHSFIANGAIVHNSICTTRKVTGHGVPQLTAIHNVWKAVKDWGEKRVPIIADGGITCSGDVVKALAVGADTIMSGSLFAGTDEAPGTIITQGNKKYKNYRGMASRSAMAERSGSRSRYFKGNIKHELISKKQQEKITPEGVEGLVEYKGPVRRIVNELAGGLQSGMAHSNARTITELRQNTQPFLQTSAGFAEGNPHHVIEQN